MTDPKPNDAFVWVQEPWGLALECPALGAPHLFTTRDVTLRDDRQEWEAVANSLDVTADRLRLIRQVHGTDVAVVRRGSTSAWALPEADIIVSDDPSVAIGVRVADCTPILLFDSRKHVVGAAHAGWRGTALSAAARAVSAMRETFGSNASDLIGAIGPSLGPCCGEVGEEVAQVFRSAGADERSIERWFRPGTAGKSHIDLWQANRDQLERAGVPREAIFSAELCTKTHNTRLHSYRAHREKAGRMLAAIRAIPLEA